MLKIGFTGTRKIKQVTPEHMCSLENFFYWFAPDEIEFHYGDCVGADEESFKAARGQGFRTVGHPPINEKFRAFTKPDEMRETKEYIDRNHDIVNETEILIAMSGTITEVLRSGTWATVRYARDNTKDIHILWPDGMVTVEQHGTIQRVSQGKKSIR